MDLTIEQALMRAVKGHGGLTHGRGGTERAKATWIATRLVQLRRHWPSLQTPITDMM